MPNNNSVVILQKIYLKVIDSNKKKIWNKLYISFITDMKVFEKFLEYHWVSLKSTLSYGNIYFHIQHFLASSNVNF